MQGTTTNGGAKFAIGLLAGIAAVLLPRLLALLSKSDDAQIVFFPLSYFMLAAGVGVFLGLVMLVIEYQVAAKPKETFMAALGIPAVLSGALGTASTAESVSDLARESERLRQAVRVEQGIVKDGVFNVFEPVGGPAQTRPAGESSWLLLPFIGTAHAEGNAVASEPVRFGVRMEQARYTVVLKHVATEREAIEEAQKLKAQIPSARAARSDKGYFVVLGNAPAAETDALLAAARAKKAVEELRPVLVEVRK
jgi:hypothetical protein